MAQSMGYKNVTEKTLIEALGTNSQVPGALASALEGVTGRAIQGGTVSFNPADLSATQIQAVVKNVTNNGSQPFMALFNAPGSSITAEGHWVLVNGFDSAGNIVIHDPAGLKYTMTAADFAKTWQTGALVVGKK